MVCPVTATSTSPDAAVAGIIFKKDNADADTAPAPAFKRVLRLICVFKVVSFLSDCASLENDGCRTVETLAVLFSNAHIAPA